MNRAICWIRRDLRLSDHRVLARACERHDEVVVVFVFDPSILKRWAPRNRRVSFILASLAELDGKLRQHGSKLVTLLGEPSVEIPELCSRLGASATYWGLDHDPFAIARDERVAAALATNGVRSEGISDQTIRVKGEVLTKGGTPFRVFTPYSRQWLELFGPVVDAAEACADLSKLVAVNIIESEGVELNHELLGFEAMDLWLEPGEEAGQAALAAFESRIDRYGETRDFPASSGVSFLSAHLRFGTVSIRSAVRAALRHDTAGAKKWLIELVWREFYQDILANFPEVVHTTYDPQYANLPWPGSHEHFESWCLGRTGFPIVDAAMRCFNETGWMHNRLRMIVASFLTKDLLVDYKKGEAYFAEGLLDFDLASNNGGWQWAASTGCDAQPYFRVFNPYLQSRKFDPDGEFIRRWVPELAGLSGEDVHNPSAFQVLECGYVDAIVDHDVQRQRAVAMFESCRLGG